MAGTGLVLTEASIYIFIDGKVLFSITKGVQVF
jgi:hypothetical protein